MSWYIEVREGFDQGKKITLNNGPVVIGRDQSRCNLILSDENISRVHARVTMDIAGSIVIEDLGSTHGTHVNRQQIHEPRVITAEDSLVLGGCSIGLVWESSVETERTEGGQNPPLDVFLIGRDPSNQLVIDDPKVSRSHARIECRPEGYYLTDSNSTYGTSLNGKKISGTVLLPMASWISIEKYHYYFDGEKLMTEKGETVAVLNPRVRSSSEMLMFSEIMAIPFKATDVLKWGIGCLLSMIPIISFFVSGYRYKLYQNGMKGSLEMPEWNDWKNLFVTGFFFSLIKFLYFLPPTLLLLAMTYIAASRVDFTTTRFIIAIIPGSLACLGMGLMLPMGWGRYVDSGKLGDAFRFTEIINGIRAVSTHYLRGVAVVIGMLIIMGMLSWIPYFGAVLLVVSSFFLMVFSGILFGNLYRLSQQYLP